MPVRDAAFRTIAGVFPTERLATSSSIKLLWRILFYTIRPKHPFVMRTPYYRLYVHPQKGTHTRSMILGGCYEAAETRAFADVVRAGGFVIDAGANYGHYSLLAANAVGASGLVVAFEPDPATHSVLVSNASLLPYNNLLTEQAGLSDATTTATLVVDARNLGGHSFAMENVEEVSHSVEVSVYRLDDYLIEQGITRSVDVMKIDVQGYEWKLLAGAEAVIRRDRPVIFCEITPSMMEAVGDDYHTLLDFFRELQYEVAVVDTGKENVEAITYEAAAGILSDPRRLYADMIFTPAMATSAAE